MSGSAAKAIARPLTGHNLRVSLERHAALLVLAATSAVLMVLCR
jgi:hypothetical protein